MIEQLNTQYGRYYKTPDGIFPSVTTVLSSIPNPELDAWKASVGPEKAALVSQRATREGTRFHSYCEGFLLGNPPKLNIIDKAAYKGIDEQLKLIEPLHVETPFWSSGLKIAGTIDCVGKYKGQYSIIDFKTTSKEKYDGEFDSYWLQLSAYSVMVYERTGLPIRNLVIIMQNLTGETYAYTSRTEKWLTSFIEARNAFEDQSALLS